MTTNGRERDRIDVLFVAKDEDLTDQEVKERWMVQLPSTNFVMLAAMGIIMGIAALLMGQWQYALIGLGGGFGLIVLVFAWQNWRASTKTREQMIEEIKRLREIHRDSDM